MSTGIFLLTNAFFNCQPNICVGKVTRKKLCYFLNMSAIQTYFVCYYVFAQNFGFYPQIVAQSKKRLRCDIPFIFNLLVPHVIPAPSVTIPSGCSNLFSGLRSKLTVRRQVVRINNEFWDKPEFRSCEQYGNKEKTELSNHFNVCLCLPQLPFNYWLGKRAENI